MLPMPNYECMTEFERRICPTCGQMFLMTLRKDSFNLRNNLTGFNGRSDFLAEWRVHLLAHLNQEAKE